MELDWSGGRSRFKWARKGQNSKTIGKKVRTCKNYVQSYPVDVFQPSWNMWVDMSDWGIIMPFLKLECNKNWLKSPLKSPEHLWRLWDDTVNTNQLVSHGFFLERIMALGELYRCTEVQKIMRSWGQNDHSQTGKKPSLFLWGIIPQMLVVITPVRK